MATMSEALAVKSLNKSSGCQRFVFKTFAQRIAEIDIDVYRSLNPVKAEPSEGSSFFRDCLVEWRELNTAEDFISFYEEMFPLVQTLPQIILQKELILSKLLSRLQLKGRLSLEPILRLIDALSRDLLEDFIPFLQRIVDSLVFLLQSGADREPEIIEQIFTSLSYIMMQLQKYLIKDVIGVLKITARLRYYPKDYVQEFMAESVSFLLRNAPVVQLRKGIRKLLLEVARKPLLTRKTGAIELLWYVMRGTSSRLHSKAERVLGLLLDKYILDIGDQLNEGSGVVLEVLISVFNRLSTELELGELNLIWKCFYEVIASVSTDCSVHLGRLISLLTSTLRHGVVDKTSDGQPNFKFDRLPLQTFIMYCSQGAENQSTELTDKILQLLLCMVDALYQADNMPTLSDVSVKWAPAFNSRNARLLIFLKELLSRDIVVLRVFRINIMSALSDLIENDNEEVIYLLLMFFERLQMPRSMVLDGIDEQKLSSICNFIRESVSYWIGLINNAVNGNPLQLQDKRLDLLWGIIKCYPYILSGHEDLSLLMDLLRALEDFLMVESGAQKTLWESIISAVLDCYKQMLYGDETGLSGSAVSKFIDLAKKYKSSSHVLSVVADALDSAYGPVVQGENRSEAYPPDLQARKLVDALKTFAQNLCHPDNVLRLSSLRILCHHEPLQLDSSFKDLPDENVGGEATQTFAERGSNVLELILEIEATPLAVDTSRKVIMLLSRIQMCVSGARIAEHYVPVLLYAILGIFHKRFSYLWNPAMECLSVLISQHFGVVWDRYIQYLDHSQSMFLISQGQSDKTDGEPLKESSDLFRRFNAFVTPPSDCTPCSTVLSLLIQTLQKVPSLAESRTRQIIPLFLKFLGYSVDDVMRVGSYDSTNCQGKEWKEALKEWLNLFRWMRNTKSFYQNQFFKDVLQYRLLDDTDSELQTRVLDCLLNWKDDFLLPYNHRLRNLINAKSLREELTTWSLSKEANLIDKGHRIYIVPVVIRILAPKVRKLKTLASRKHASIHLRRAILGFLAQLDIDELPLFFALLMKPLLTISRGAVSTAEYLWGSGIAKDEFISYHILKQFTVDGISGVSWKKRYGFLHVIEEVLEVFDEWHISPFLDLLMGCVVRVLESCATALDRKKSAAISPDESNCNMNEGEHGSDKEIEIMTSSDVKQFKELRSLCLKIISLALGKYENYDFGSEFWDGFFSAVKPLIAGFKQEGASSEKPSSLFSCFLAMSRSRKFVPLLSREKNLVPDIFLMLTIPTASNAIVSGVFKFLENILNLDDERQSVNFVLLPHLDVIVSSLHSLYTADKASKRKHVKNPGEKELIILRSLSQYIEKPSAARKFVDILLPLLARRSYNPDSCVDVLQNIRNTVTVVGNESSEEIISSLAPLLAFAGLEVRASICNVLNALAERDSSVLNVAKLLSELNATSAMETGDLDYDTIIAAYEGINKDFFHPLKKDHALLLLSHSVHDMSSQEMILRQSAYRLLLCFIEFAGEIVGQNELLDQECWSEASIREIVCNFLLKQMGNAMNKETAVQKVWIDLLREMVLKLPMVAQLGSYEILFSQDPEQDFFNNIIHLQKHRRARALSRFANTINSGNLSEGITNKVFVPLFFNVLFDLQHGKDENIRSACLEALASVSGCMSWKQYYSMLSKCFRELTMKPEKKKVLLRLICSILDRFHFQEAQVNHETNEPAETFAARDSSKSLISGERSKISCEFADIQACLQKTILPKIQKLLTSDTDNVNVYISLVALKLLKLLPDEVMDLHLPSIIHRISNFMKNRLESVRDEARSALAACLKELGLEYLQFLVKVLMGILKRGYELHVLGYTVHFMLSKFLVNPISGKLDYCLDDLLSVIENDILGDVSEEKEVDKIASKMKETRKEKSFETLKLIAQSITFRTHALKLLSPITVHLQKQLTLKVKSKLEKMLNHIAAGIESNPSVNLTELFVFVYRIIKNGIDDERLEPKSTCTSKLGKRERDEADRGIDNLDKLFHVDPRYSHLLTGFALRLLQNFMKNSLSRKDEELFSFLDPFVGVLCDCLSSKYENVVSTALRCLSSLVRLPLPSLQFQTDKIKNSLLVIAQGSMNAGNPLTESCLKLLTVLLRSTRITLSSDQLHMLIQFPLFIDIEKNPSFVALSLLKSIVNRKLVVPEIYDLAKRVAELMVTSQDESIRKKCSQILLQFLLDYRLSEKRLQQHLDFLLANLRYEHSTGREAVLEMLHAIIMKFPVSVVDEQSQTVFVHLVVCLANDHDNKVRTMTGAAIKLLIGRVSPHSLHSFLEYSLSWYVGDKQQLWSAAAQVLGLLVEVMKKGFHKHIKSVMSVMERVLQSAINALSVKQLDITEQGAISMWREAYYSLILLEKILLQFESLCLQKDLEELWEMICQFLMLPHLWLRNISNRLVALYFTHVTESCRETLFLMKPARLYFIAASLCCQLKTQPVDDGSCTLILQNLVFAISHFHSLTGVNENMEFLKFWFDLEVIEQELFLKAFELLDSKKGRSTILFLTSDLYGQSGEQTNECNEDFFISYLLKKMGKISLQVDTRQMRIIFGCFKSISAPLLRENKTSTMVDGKQNYAYQILLPLYKVCEGYAGKVISDDTKQFAHEVCESIRDNMGMQNFVHVYSQIRKNLKVKRDKRKQGEKLMAVINPMRNAKRKLRVAAKHRANKKRKIMAMKMARWMR